ncbi:WG repeat-containing protein [Halarcobacter bivalviorum]|uniref:WG_beta_rep domain-containing protein n=1 Tax=Halarcobacter bivalviorum TaxID=663364 RepID=A0AAX2A954_9BACT|nr:WG repeat-containing protein [Halarcobacter bivalviorum]AXH13378.1 WG_beta_rep domain-containing protein [Halarcobacter bivalviorum]RXK10019.1 hypothetical protein CRV05_06480 [Halarcobacter bivalviorum]
MRQIFILIATILVISGCSFKDNTTVVSESNKDGVINKDGEVIVKPIYKKVYNFTTVEDNNYSHPHYINLHWLHIDDKEYAVVKNIDNKLGIIDKDGDLKLKAIFDSIGQFFNGYAKVEIAGKYGLINEDFEVVLKPIYDEVRNVIDGSIIVKNYTKNGQAKYACLDTDMDMVASFDYDMIYLSNEERMRIVKDDKWGFMNTDCKVTVEPKYSFVDDYSRGIARVKIDNLWSYVDLNGDEITPKSFTDADNF